MVLVEEMVIENVLSIYVTLSGKSSLILGENKAAFPRGRHLNLIN